MNRRLYALGAPFLAAAALSMSACSPEGGAGPSSGTDFCTTMATVTNAAGPADTALNTLLDSLNDPALLQPGSSLEAVNTASEAVVSQGGAMADALDAAAHNSAESLVADLTAMKDFWVTYAVPLGEVASEATDYDGLIEAARPLLETSHAVTAEEAAARQNVASAYATACNHAAAS